MFPRQEAYQLAPIPASRSSDPSRSSSPNPTSDLPMNEDVSRAGPADRDDDARETLLDRRTVRKLDFILLPFLALLFLFNSLDRSNIGNAESAHFTDSIGLSPGDLNTAVALCFAFFVALQPLGAALGRRYGMAVWVPRCMTAWGVCTALHAFVRNRWQLYTLRIIIGILEAGFYPVTVSYLSLFYTRYEFARRLALFYGQAAIAGAFGGILSYAVFSHFDSRKTTDEDSHKSAGWKSWQVLFLVEGVSTIVIAATGFFWLPHNAKRAWFFSRDEGEWAEERIKRDRVTAFEAAQSKPEDFASDVETQDDEDEEDLSESHRQLLPSSSGQASSATVLTDDRGLTAHDMLSAMSSPKIYHILVCNILSSIPVTAFSIFLPLIIRSLTNASSAKTSPALVNLLTAPPYIIGASSLYLVTHISDHRRLRLPFILLGLGVVMVGLLAVQLMPATWHLARYFALCVLLSGSYIPSPLTVAWISENTPSAGKRAMMLGINGWGNLAGIFAALIFHPDNARNEKEDDSTPSYSRALTITALCVLVSAAGYLFFWVWLVRENRARAALLASWSPEQQHAEEKFGTGPHLTGMSDQVWQGCDTLLQLIPQKVVGRDRLHGWRDGLRQFKEAGREGDEKITFTYGF